MDERTHEVVEGTAAAAVRCSSSTIGVGAGVATTGSLRSRRSHRGTKREPVTISH
jgi:hypothetical protein